MVAADPSVAIGNETLLVSTVCSRITTELERKVSPALPRDTSTLHTLLSSLPKREQSQAAHQILLSYIADPENFPGEAGDALIRAARMIAYQPYGEPAVEFVCFGDFCRKEMQLQCQYGSRYVHGRMVGYPHLGEGLRFLGDSSDYHSLKMHVDDIPIFLQRFRDYRNSRK